MLKRRGPPVRTLWDVLFGTRDENGLTRWNELLAGADVRDAIRSQAPWAPPGVTAVVQGQVAAAGRRAMEGIALADVLRHGWSRYADLLAAARHTRDHPGSTETVALARHTLPADHEVHLDVLVDGHLVTTVHLGARLELVVHSVVAEVAHGAVVALASGSATATGTLTLAGTPVLTKARDVDLSSLLRRDVELQLLRPPIVLPGQTGVGSGAGQGADVR